MTREEMKHKSCTERFSILQILTGTCTFSFQSHLCLCISTKGYWLLWLKIGRVQRVVRDGIIINMELVNSRGSVPELSALYA